MAFCRGLLNTVPVALQYLVPCCGSFVLNPKLPFTQLAAVLTALHTAHIVARIQINGEGSLIFQELSMYKSAARFSQ